MPNYNKYFTLLKKRKQNVFREYIKLIFLSLSNWWSCNVRLSFSQLFLFISLWPLESSTETKEQTFNNTYDGNAREERHEAAKLCNKLKTRLGIVVDVLILSWAHVQFQNNRVRHHACNTLTWTCYQSLLGCHLAWTHGWIRCRCKISAKLRRFILAAAWKNIVIYLHDFYRFLGLQWIKYFCLTSIVLIFEHWK